MTTENDEVHGTVIRSGYDPEPEADPTLEPSDQTSDEGPDDAAEDDASSPYAANGERSPADPQEPLAVTEDDERYLKPADSAAEDNGTLADSAAEDDPTTGDSTAEDNGTLADSTAEDNGTLADSTAEGNGTLADRAAEDNRSTAQSSLESDEEGTGGYEGSADEDDEDEIIVVDSSDSMAQDEPLDSADEETGEAGDLEALDEDRVVPDDMGGQAAPATDAVMPAHAAPVPAHSRMPSDREFGDDTGLAGDPEEMRRRWASIQSSFVDDPRESVADAASFLSEVMTTLLANAEQREHELRGEWDRDDLDTEDLRTVLRRYRGFIDRLAAL